MNENNAHWRFSVFFAHNFSVCIVFAESKQFQFVKQKVIIYAVLLISILGWRKKNSNLYLNGCIVIFICRHILWRDLLMKCKYVWQIFCVCCLNAFFRAVFFGWCNRSDLFCILERQLKTARLKSHKNCAICARLFQLNFLHKL